MTSQDESGKSPQDNHDPLEETQQLNDTSSRSRHKRGRLWIGLSVLVLAGVTAALVSVATGGTHNTAAIGSTGAGASSSAAAGSTGSESGSGATTPKGINATKGATPPKGTSTTKGKVI